MKPLIFSETKKQTVHQIKARIPDIVLLTKKKGTSDIADFAVRADQEWRKKRWKVGQIPSPRQKVEIGGEHEGDCDVNRCWNPYNGTQDPVKVTGY